MKKPQKDQEIEENWNSTWKSILENPDGSINVQQLKLELMDFSHIMRRMTTLVCKLTNDRLSYPTYSVKTILRVMEECKEEDLRYQLKDDKKDRLLQFL